MKPQTKDNASTKTPSKHLEHVEDLMFGAGTEGLKQTTQVIQNVLFQLRGSTKSKINITEKWDGSPSMFIGKHPETGETFIATKGLLNKEPKYATSVEQIKEIYPPGLAAKMVPFFNAFQLNNFKGIFQGDVLFWDDESKKQLEIDGHPYLIFKPNTLVYAASKGSHAFAQAAKNKMAIVWHTKYEGKTLNDLSPSYGITEREMPKATNVWSLNAEWEYKHPLDMFSSQFFNKMVHKLNTIIATAEQNKTIDTITADQELIQLFRQFNNVKIKNNNDIKSYGNYIREFQTYVLEYYQKQADKVKQDKTKIAKLEKAKAHIESIQNNYEAWYFMLDAYTLAIDLKLSLLSKLHQSSLLSTFIEDNGGLNSTDPEGYVVVDGDLVVKFVDRLSFSRFNFNSARQTG